MPFHRKNLELQGKITVINGNWMFFCRLVFLLSLCAFWFQGAASLSAADPISLARVGDSWRHLPGTAEPSQPTNAWRLPDFDDSAWQFGRSGFSLMADEATVLFGSSTVSSWYFRKNFLVGDTNLIKWLLLRVDYDDGLVAYLNGQEIARRNLQGDPVSFQQVASQARARGAAEEINVSEWIGQLRNGNNTLALQVHSVSAFDYSLALVPELLANFQRGPMIQNLTDAGAQIIWRTPVPSDTQLWLGTNSLLSEVWLNPIQTNEHVVTLTNLVPGTRYFYRVASGTNVSDRAISPIFSFQSAPPAGADFSFALLGDSGYGSTAQLQVAQLLQSLNPNLVLHAGDIIYGHFTAGRADTRLLSIYGEQQRSTPYFFTIGNHDLYAHPTLGDLDYLDTFYLPTNDATGTEHYYSFDYGDAHFVSLFVPLFSQFPQHILAAPSAENPNGSRQYQWLTNDLARSSKPWKFLFFHVPIRTSSAHRFDDYDANGSIDGEDLQRILLPVVKKYGVQMIMNGHDHAYERFHPVNGMQSIVSGGGGVYLYGLYQQDMASAQFFSVHHCVKVSVSTDSLVLEAVNPSGAVFDRVFYQRRQPVAQLHQSTWHTPVVESTGANNLDGNIIGQRFDLEGNGIPGLVGDFSNLGRLLVNNDRTHLYLGFQQTSIFRGNSIYLLIESPTRSGVASLTGLGDGIYDPQGEGVEALDLLENLSFTNFSPAIAMVLGEELVDQTVRNLGVPPAVLDPGQGSFYLSPGFPSVPGFRLQQFNRSPEGSGVAGEESADFIEMAIPLTALGRIQPGDIIKVAAVVGGTNYNTNSGMFQRNLDSGFVGLQLTTNLSGHRWLEGVRVQLAADPDPDSDGLSMAQELALGTNPLNADSDDDGLKDGWEVAYGFDPLSAGGADGGTGDPDGDGMNNWQEQLAGTDPRQAASVLRMSLSLNRAAQEIQMNWSTITGRLYSVEAASGYPSNFMTLPGVGFPRTGNGSNMSFLQSINFEPRFFRLRVSE